MSALREFEAFYVGPRDKAVLQVPVRGQSRHVRGSQVAGVLGPVRRDQVEDAGPRRSGAALAHLAA
jgi:hypothetical protein